MFGFHASPTKLHNLVHPGENMQSLIDPSEFLNFIPMSFDFNPVISLRPWCAAVSRQDHGKPW